MQTADKSGNIAAVNIPAFNPEQSATVPVSHGPKTPPKSPAIARYAKSHAPALGKYSAAKTSVPGQSIAVAKPVKPQKARAITGLSMGGHGALYLAFRHPDIFGSAGSTSGGVDFRPFPENWELSERLGKYEEYPENWENNTVINMTHLIRPGQINLIIDCGTEDFFYEVNCNLHEKLLKEGIPHDFHVRPGVHWWTYWRNSIQYQILYFSLCFEYAFAA